MKPDLYTKSVLTVIAASLLWLCVQNTVQPQVASAQDEKSTKKKTAKSPADRASSPPPLRVIIDGFGPNVHALPVTNANNSLGQSGAPLLVTIQGVKDITGRDTSIPITVGKDDTGREAALPVRAPLGSGGRETPIPITVQDFAGRETHFQSGLRIY